MPDSAKLRAMPNVAILKPVIAEVLQVRHPSRSLTLVQHLGGIGLVPLAILDSSIIPTFGSLDLLTAWLAAGSPHLWWYYAFMSTLGAVIGAFLTYRLGKKMGTEWIEKKIGSKRLKQVGNAIERWHFGAISVSTIAPPPFPTAWFLLVAGAFDFSLKRYLSAVLAGRALRYTLLTLVAAHYGRHFLRYLRHPAHYLLISIIVTASLVAAVYLFTGKRRAGAAAASADLVSQG
jgi:membrane protein YqaA with SNARE-associated domain